LVWPDDLGHDRLRDSPEPPGLSSIVKKTFAAGTMSSRRVYFRRACPVISSEVP
jgi:hypothetical protein